MVRKFKGKKKNSSLYYLDNPNITFTEDDLAKEVDTLLKTGDTDLLDNDFLNKFYELLMEYTIPSEILENLNSVKVGIIRDEMLTYYKEGFNKLRGYEDPEPY